MKVTTALALTIGLLAIVVIALLLVNVKPIPGVELLKTYDKGANDINTRTASAATGGAAPAHVPTVAEQVAAMKKLGYDDTRIAANLNVSVNDLNKYL